jgi:hypothetical protein
MFRVFDLDPMLRRASAVGAISALRDKSLQTKFAGREKQARIDFAVFERRDENPVRPPRQQPRQIVLPEMQGQDAQILPIQRQRVEGVKLDLFVMLAGVPPVEI